MQSQSTRNKISLPLLTYSVQLTLFSLKTLYIMQKMYKAEPIMTNTSLSVVFILGQLISNADKGITQA